jgi:hypothetical protein
MNAASQSDTTPRFEPKLRNRLAARFYFFLEFVEISLCSPKGPGLLMRWFFKGPILLDRLGLGSLLGKSARAFQTIAQLKAELCPELHLTRAK